MGSKKYNTYSTERKGYCPEILDSADPLIQDMLDNTVVEYGSGCWLSTSARLYPEYVQVAVWELFNGALPEDWEVVNTCSDFRPCFNPKCLVALPLTWETECLEDL